MLIPDDIRYLILNPKILVFWFGFLGFKTNSQIFGFIKVDLTNILINFSKLFFLQSLNLNNLFFDRKSKLLSDSAIESSIKIDASL